VAVVESVKAASDVYSPLTGEVVAVNDAVVAEPALVNSEAEKQAWLFKIRFANPAELDGLMDETAYRQHIA
jgi:glycine cleavage system H protein